MSTAHPVLLHLLAGFLVGIGSGAAYFAALRRNVRLYVGGGSTSTALALHLLRLLSAGAIFYLLARIGPGVLFGALGGFILMRSIAVRRWEATA
jgi:F1F0 ATPase subunit 2